MQGTPNSHFRTTRWSIVRSSHSEGPAARAALDELCEAYWYPLYAYLRRRGEDDGDALELVQSFLAGVLEGGAFDGATPDRGTFRAYLVGALKHHASNERRKDDAEKRGGGRVRSLDLALENGAAAQRYSGQGPDRTPEQEFEHAWALEVVQRATDRLEQEAEERGRGEMFDVLRDTLDGSDGDMTHAERAAELGCSVGAVRVNAHRLRQRLGELIRDEIAQTVDETAQQESAIETELRHLVSVLGGQFSDPV